jgi:hypothetical protein
MSTKISTLAQNPTARKVVGSLGVIGAAAAVAGMGTFGSFTTSTSPVSTTVNSGTLSINLTQPGFAIPVSTNNFMPGDSMTRSVNLVNDGVSPLGSVALNVTAGAPTVLTTDVTNGLQVAVKSCSVPWTQGGTSSAATYTCSGTTTPVASGPAVGSFNLAGMKALTAGGTDYLTFAISLPTTADNTFQGKSSTLTLSFTGSQATGTAR